MANLNLREAAIALLNANGLANERLNYVMHLINTDRLKDLPLKQREDLASALLSLEAVFEQLQGTMQAFNEVRSVFDQSQ
ncbi:hypothetical protein WBG78_17055 [Chryseolinea sp. T2]|uniref:hypothetical protein n=1 Tax=Chryseolinea sp. T2 TaxID=3129255 RepID=UPI0030780A69